MERFNENSLVIVKELVPESHPEFKMWECILRAGSHWEPELFPLSDRMQMFYFLNTTGYAATAKKAWMISEDSLFIPNYDKEDFWLEAGENDLRFVWFQGKMNDYDQKEFIDYHIILPTLKTKEKSFSFTEYYTGGAGSSIISRRLVLDTAFGRWFVGIDEGEGVQAFVSSHVLPHFHQWNYPLPGSDILYTLDGKEYRAAEGDAYYIPKAAESSAKPVNGGKIRYLWIKFASDGFPVGRDGYPGSEE